MKVLILAGGYGTRISEETGIRPKPMVEIGEKPILWHIMKHYSTHGFNEFVILCGYKGHCIKEYFANYFTRESSVTFNLAENTMEVVNSGVEKWKVTCLDTGDGTLTGGRIKRAQDFVGDEPFLLTYGDGVSDVDVRATVESHKETGRLCTMTAVQPGGRFGVLNFDENDQLVEFIEKPKGEAGWINGGFFVCQPEVFNYLKDGDKTIFERNPLETLTNENQVNCYKHKGFWKCMDTLADKKNLVKMWESGEAQWKTW
jgi:glucose-1-phosphate cytidylyltransferase